MKLFSSTEIVSLDSGQTYVVSMALTDTENDRRAQLFCTCPDFRFHRFERGEICKHIALAQNRGDFNEILSLQANAA